MVVTRMVLIGIAPIKTRECTDSARDYEDWRTLTRTHGYTHNRASDELVLAFSLD